MSPQGCNWTKGRPKTIYYLETLQGQNWLELDCCLRVFTDGLRLDRNYFYFCFQPGRVATLVQEKNVSKFHQFLPLHQLVELHLYCFVWQRFQTFADTLKQKCFRRALILSIPDGPFFFLRANKQNFKHTNQIFGRNMYT